MFFLFLIVACLSISQDKLEPVKSKMPSTNLVSIAKTDPLALVQMLDGANPEAVGKIVAILNGLIQDGDQEYANLVKAVAVANKKVKTTQNTLRDLLELEGQALSQLQKMQKIEAVATGKYVRTLAEYRRVSPRLEKEINVLRKVLGMLQTLLNNNTPNSKELLELGSTEKGKAYLKLIANVQADPDKLRKIIGYVGTLLDEAERDLETMVNDVKQAKKVMDLAMANTRKALAKHQQAVRERKECQAQLVRDVAARDAAELIRVRRGAILAKEKKTLQQVITLLESTADKN